MLQKGRTVENEFGKRSGAMPYPTTGRICDRVAARELRPPPSPGKLERHTSAAWSYRKAIARRCPAEKLDARCHVTELGVGGEVRARKESTPH